MKNIDYESYRNKWIIDEWFEKSQKKSKITIAWENKIIEESIGLLK